MDVSLSASHNVAENSKEIFCRYPKSLSVHLFLCWYYVLWMGFPCGSAGKESSCSVGDLGSILGWEGPVAKRAATYSSSLTWRSLWSVKSMGSQSRRWLGDFQFHCPVNSGCFVLPTLCASSPRSESPAGCAYFPSLWQSENFLHVVCLSNLKVSLFIFFLSEITVFYYQMSMSWKLCFMYLACLLF